MKNDLFKEGNVQALRKEKEIGGLKIVQQMDNQAAAQFGLEPGRFGRHDFAGVGNPHQGIDSGGIEGKGNAKGAGVDDPLQFGVAADAADKVDARIRARIADLQNRLQDMVQQDVDIQAAEHIIAVEQSIFGGEFPPDMIQIHAKGVFFFDLDPALHWFERELFRQPVDELLCTIAVQVPDRAVVGKNLQLVVREEDR